METSQFNTQNFYPKYLDVDEINDPLIVIRDFFSADWLPGHKDDFNPDIEMVKALSDKVCKLFITAEGLYNQAMETLKD